MFDEITQRERQPRAKREFRERDSDFRVRAIANMGGGNIKGGFGFFLYCFSALAGIVCIFVFMFVQNRNR